MKLTQAQLKGRLKSLAQKNHADARILIRIYMMERFLERVSTSRYKDNFIIKGGNSCNVPDWCCPALHHGY